MNPHVSIQIYLLFKAFVTHVTNKRVFPGMNPHVSSQPIAFTLFIVVKSDFSFS